jgi:hypothetical protein
MKNSSKISLSDFILLKFYNYLSMVDSVPKRTYLYDFDQMTKEIKPADVLLVEGHTRIGNLIKLISESTWTHAAIYIGKPGDIEDKTLSEKVLEQSKALSSDQLIIESILGKGTVVSSIDSYKDEHIRILRPVGLLPEDIQEVIAYAINHIGKKYSLRHVFDLARFIFPWRILPRKWRSSLFQHNISQPTEDTCSSMIADAFQSVNFPILPLVLKDEKEYALVRRNPRLYTPSDFDLSPFFDVIKYPIFPLKEGMTYRDLPWEVHKISDDINTVDL